MSKLEKKRKELLKLYNSSTREKQRLAIKKLREFISES